MEANGENLAQLGYDHAGEGQQISRSQVVRKAWPGATELSQTASHQKLPEVGLKLVYHLSSFAVPGLQVLREVVSFQVNQSEAGSLGEP